MLFRTSKTDPNGKGHAKTNLLQINSLYTHGTENQVVVCCDNYSPLIEVACEYFSIRLNKLQGSFRDSSNDPLANIMQAQGRNFFRCVALVQMTGFRIRTKIFSGESVSQSAQSSKFEIHRACVFSM